MKRIQIYDPRCSSCDFLIVQGCGVSETKYCSNFKRRKPRRFRASDPKYKVPSWCPRLLRPPMLRVYRLDDVFRLPGDLLETGTPAPERIVANALHYRLEQETTSGMTARQFYQTVSKHRNVVESVENIEIGDIIEIDDGIRPYFFYCYDYATVVEAIGFRKEKVGELRRCLLEENENGEEHR